MLLHFPMECFILILPKNGKFVVYTTATVASIVSFTNRNREATGSYR